MLHQNYLKTQKKLIFLLKKFNRPSRQQTKTLETRLKAFFKI
jgi:hypothetical protein